MSHQVHLSGTRIVRGTVATLLAAPMAVGSPALASKVSAMSLNNTGAVETFTNHGHQAKVAYQNPTRYRDVT